MSVNKWGTAAVKSLYQERGAVAAETGRGSHSTWRNHLARPGEAEPLHASTTPCRAVLSRAAPSSGWRRPLPGPPHARRIRIPWLTVLYPTLALHTFRAACTALRLSSACATKRRRPCKRTLAPVCKPGVGGPVAQPRKRWRHITSTASFCTVRPDTRREPTAETTSVL